MASVDGRKFDSRPPRQLLLRWVTVFGRANHLSISPNHPQFSLLPSAGLKMSTGGDALRLGSKGRYGSFHVDKREDGR